jgi:hypothetical protein
MNYEKRMAYYQNISKRALEIEFEKAIEEFLKDKI